MKRVTFGDAVKINEIIDDKVDINFSCYQPLKTWSGVNKNDKIFEKLVLLVMNNNVDKFDEYMKKMTIFDLHILKHKIRDLSSRIVENDKNYKKTIIILNKGGGKGIFLPLNIPVYEKINFILSYIEKRMVKIKTRSCIF